MGVCPNGWFLSCKHPIYEEMIWCASPSFWFKPPYTPLNGEPKFADPFSQYMDPAMVRWSPGFASSAAKSPKRWKPGSHGVPPGSDVCVGIILGFQVAMKNVENDGWIWMDDESSQQCCQVRGSWTGHTLQAAIFFFVRPGRGVLTREQKCSKSEHVW